MSIWHKNAAAINPGRLEMLDVKPATVVGRSAMAAQACASAYPADRYAYIVLGIGDGTLLRALYNHISEHSVVIVCERKMEYMRAAFEQVDVSAELQAKRLLLLDRVEPSYINLVLATARDTLCRNPVLIEPYLSYDDSWWMEAVSAILDYADTQRTCLCTEIHNSRVTCNNLLDNIRDYSLAPDVGAWEGLHKDQPVVLVAAGPSIDKQLSQLRKAQGSAVIVSCLTMLKPLMQYDIVPDYVTALDYAPVSGRFLEGIGGDLENITFIMDPKVNRTVISGIRSLHARLAFIGSPWLDVIGGITGRNFLPSGCTVAHFNFVLAQHLGCDPIMMIGQDLAFTDGLYYPECVKKAHEWKIKPDVGPTCEERAQPGFNGVTQVDTGEDGPILYTDEQMRAYHHQFELLWAEAEQQVIDCTEGGAPKKSVDACVPFAVALQEHAAEPLEPRHAKVKTKPTQSTTRAVKRRLTRVRTELEKYIQAVKAVISTHEQWWSLTGAGPTPEVLTPGHHEAIQRSKVSRDRIIELGEVHQLVVWYSGASERGQGWAQEWIKISGIKDDELRKAHHEADMEYSRLQMVAARDLYKKVKTMVSQM